MRWLMIVYESIFIPSRCNGRISKALCVMLSLMVFNGCCRGEISMDPNNNKISSTLSETQLNRVRAMKIFFGHQSVGKNLIDGLNDIAAKNSAARLNIVETNSLDGKSGPVFAHFSVGSNTKPDSKIASFAKHMAKGGKDIDVAFFKFCYVDTGMDTDVDGLFQRYQKTMTEMKKQFPDVTFVHVTIPLTSLETGLKGGLKKMLGKPIGEEVNVVRTRYNNLLRKEYAVLEPLFDLAAVESTAPDGSRLQGQKNGAAYEALCPQYTYDGGHLNELGRKHCALALLQTLAKVGESDKAKKK